MIQSTTSDRTQRMEWSNWVKGDTFAFGLEDVEAVDEDAYQACNMQVYSDGTLGVRPWAKRHGSLTGTSNSGLFQSDDRRLHGRVAGDARYSDTPGSWTTAGAGAGGSPVPLGRSRYYDGNGNIVIPVANAQLYLAASTALTKGYVFAAPPNFFTPGAGALYKNRLYTLPIASTTTTDLPARIHYSGLGVPGTFAAVDYFDTAPNFYDGYYNLGLWALADALMILRSDGVWLALTGEDPQVGNLREVGVGRVTLPWQSAIVGGEILFLGGSKWGVTRVSPNGADDLKEDYIRPRTSPYFGSLLAVRGGYSQVEDVVHLMMRTNGGYYSVERVNQVWNNVRLFAATETEQSAVRLGGTHDIDDSLITPLSNLHIMSVTSGNSTFSYTRHLSLNRPSGIGDSLSDKEELLPGGSSTVSAGSVALRRVAAPDSGLLRIRRVHIEARYWKSASNFATPALTCSVIDQDGSVSGTTVWSGASLSDPADFDEGGSTKITFMLPERTHQDWNQVRLAGIQSLSIKRVTVEYEIIDTLDRG